MCTITYLQEWFEDAEKKPLIIKGARQIGKTESIRRFSRNHYQNVVEINFIEQPQFRMILSDGYSPKDIIRNMTRIDPGLTFTAGNTLIFFDEIQAYPDITTSLKFFAIDGSYDVICSGSLLGVNYKQIESVSVGYKMDYEMYSLDFEEFLWAKGYDDSLREELLDHMVSVRPLSEATYVTLNRLFLDYVILGGIPEVVERYIVTDSFSGINTLQKQIIAGYRDDIRKYAEGVDQTRITRVFDSIPVHLSKENKKFQVSKVASGARFNEYGGCVDWLQDTGLLTAMLDEESQEDLRINRNLGVYKGAVYENVVGEALYKAGYGLYYYKREDGTLEEDFFVRDQNNLIPVEVKSRSGKSQSMKTLIQNDKYEDITWGIKLSMNNIGYHDQLYTFPYFCTFLLRDWLRAKECR